MTDPKSTILGLLDAGHELAALAEAEINVREAEHHARRALGYFNAAQTLLSAFAELHNELIDEPRFVSARRFARKWVL